VLAVIVLRGVPSRKGISNTIAPVHHQIRRLPREQPAHLVQKSYRQDNREINRLSGLGVPEDPKLEARNNRAGEPWLDHEADIAKVQEWLGHANFAIRLIESRSTHYLFHDPYALGAFVFSVWPGRSGSCPRPEPAAQMRAATLRLPASLRSSPHRFATLPASLTDLPTLPVSALATMLLALVRSFERVALTQSAFRLQRKALRNARRAYP
jgi:hypothetical protein